MIAGLKSGHIRYAGLDVFNTEPLPADHPLTKLPNVTLSAHSAFRTPEASENLMGAAWGALPTDCEGMKLGALTSPLPLWERVARMSAANSRRVRGSLRG